VHLIAALTSWGHTATFAAGTAGLFGILSVAGRLATTGLQRRYRTSSVVAVIFAVQALAIGLLPFIGRNAIAVIAAVIGFGLGFGVSAIAKPVLLADRYDTRRYATIAGTIVVPMTIAKAGAPLAAAALHARSGAYTSVLVTTAALCALAAVTLWATSAYPRYRPETTDVQETPS
jgi:predicted MFS family arabinose efflux permease